MNIPRSTGNPGRRGPVNEPIGTPEPSSLRVFSLLPLEVPIPVPYPVPEPVSERVP
jgi:hypothetical protein